jgi:site-specific recombinase XerC
MTHTRLPYHRWIPPCKSLEKAVNSFIRTNSFRWPNSRASTAQSWVETISWRSSPKKPADWKSRFAALEKDGAGTVTIHHGRHAFISHAMTGGRTLAKIRDAGGHSNVSITSAYLDVAVDEDGTPDKLLGS